MNVRERFNGQTAAEQHVFDDSFDALSFYASDDGRLGSIEIAIRRAGKSYVISLESYPVHMQRMAMDMDEEGAEKLDNHVYVVAGEEILPSELLELKQKSLDELQPFLVEQE
jgi:hypothetical protein